MIALLLALTLVQAPLECEYSDVDCRLHNLEVVSDQHITREEYLVSRQTVYAYEDQTQSKEDLTETIERVVVGGGLLSMLIGKENMKALIKRLLGG